MLKGQVMIVLKYIILFSIFMSSSYLGFLMSRRYKNRVLELREFKEAINILENRIKFTYKPLGEIFDDIINLYNRKSVIMRIFKITNENMNSNGVSKSWENAIDGSKNILSLNSEDISVIKGLGKLLR